MTCRRALIPLTLFAVLAVAPAAWAEEVVGPPAPAPAAARLLRPDDGRRTVRSYHRNLLDNLLAVPSRGNLPLMAFGASLTGTAGMFDTQVAGAFDGRRLHSYGRLGADLGHGTVVAGLAAGFFAAGRVAHGERFRAVTYDASQAILVNAVYTLGMKQLVGRERPSGADRLSFPSGHTSSAFAWATVVGKHYGWKGGLPAYALATFIGTSRMAHRSHHLSDVVAGAVLGHVVGRTVVKRNRRAVPGVSDAGPQVSLLPSGAGLQLSVSF